MATVTVVVNAPPEPVFDYLADPRNRPEWQSSLRGVEMLTSGEPGTGTRWRDLTAARLAPVMEIDAFLRPTTWSETGAWRGLTATLGLSFRPLAGQRTEVEADFALSGHGLWSVVAAAAAVAAPPALRSDLRRAARIVEARWDSAASAD